LHILSLRLISEYLLIVTWQLKRNISLIIKSVSAEQESSQASHLTEQFSQITTSETKNGFLLIEIFRKLFNTQNDGHQGSLLGGLLFFIRSCWKPSFMLEKTPK
jgi:hypothetical protein